MGKGALIVGGGIAGLQAALQLADSGYPVSLVTDEATLGGKLAAVEASAQVECLWDKALNISALYLGGSLHAAPVILGSLILRAANHPNICIYPHAKLSGLQGETGDFSARLTDAATGQPVADIRAGAVILATGFDMIDAASQGQYGYGRYRNVITSLELERLLAVSRREGSIRRPSDDKRVGKMAFVQCVGSRDMVAGRGYCSSICCMFTAKEAILVSELDPEAQVGVFYIDTRACGKDFDQFLQQAKNLGVRYIRSIISDIKEDPVTENLSVRYLEAGRNRQEEFDLIVLAVGIQPPASLARTAALLGIALNDYGFVAVNQFCPVMTSRPGIYIVGGGQGPLEVSETLALSASAAAIAAEALGQPAQRPIRRPVSPEDTRQESPRVGVFICRGGLSGTGVDPAQVAAALKEIADVAVVVEDSLLCTASRIQGMQRIIKENYLNRVLVAPCFLKTNRLLFQEALQTAGIHPLLLETAELSSGNGADGSDQGRLLETLCKAVANLKNDHPLTWHLEPVVPSAMVVGGGISGMAAALAIADRGFKTTIIEKKNQLGGFLTAGSPGFDDDELLLAYQDILTRVKGHPNIEVLANCRVVGFKGRQGRFISTLECSEGAVYTRRSLEHGVTILATGTLEYEPEEYLYGSDSRIMTGTQFSGLLQRGGLPDLNAKVHVFIQCVGSRNKERQYCSRTCCLQSIDSALAIKKMDPGAQIYLFYRDVRTPGFGEKRYQKARQAGVLFVEYEEAAPPVLQGAAGGALVLTAVAPALGGAVEISPDLVILSAAQVAPPETGELAQLFHLQVNQDGLLMETHNNIGSIAFPNGGIFVAGAGQGPKSVAECLSQAQGVAARAARILRQPFLRMGGTVAVVDAEKCVACLTCVRLCPFAVPIVDREKKTMGSASISAADCRGCGLCAAECPSGAIEQQHYENEQIRRRIDVALSEVDRGI